MTREARRRCPQDAGYLAHDGPLSAFIVEVAGDVGTSPPRTASSPPRTASSPPRTAISLPANGGICSIRGATRRRHADRMLLMVQNPHRHPWRHAPSLASFSLTGAGLPGGAPTNAGGASPTVLCRTGAGRTGADKRRKGVADRNGAGEGAASSATTLVADEARRLIGKIQPVLIGCNAPLRLECPRPAAFLPNKHNPPYGLILPEALQSERTSAADAPPTRRRCPTTPGTKSRPMRCVLSPRPAGDGTRTRCCAGW